MKPEFLDACYNELYHDASLQQILIDEQNNLTEVQIFLQEAQPDTLFPYLVYDLKEGGTPDELYPSLEGTFVVSVWDRKNDKLRTMRAIERIKGMFENGYVPFLYDLNGEAVGTAVRFRYLDKMPVPTGREDVWREDIFFYVRLWDQGTARAVLARPI